MDGFLVEGSTGARAVQLLRECGPGTTIDTFEFARLLGVRAQALHQLLLVAVRLRLIKKTRGRGHRVLWALGPGNDGANIERRSQPTPAQLAQRQKAAARRAKRAQERRAEQDLQDGLAAAAAAAAPAASDPLEAFPTWLVGVAARQVQDRSQVGCAGQPEICLTTWNLRYQGGGRTFCEDVQVLAVHLDTRQLNVWRVASGDKVRIDFAGCSRIVRVATGRRVDLDAWLAKWARQSMRERITNSGDVASSALAQLAQSGEERSLAAGVV